MRTERPLKIVAMGTYLPEVVPSSSLEASLGIPAGWSEKYSGVRSRHHVTHESNGIMGARAAENALEKAQMTLTDIDMLISASGSYDYPIPNQASVIKRELKGGLEQDFPAIDIDCTCLSFVTALDFASRLLEADGLKTILIVSSEMASKGLNESNWETATLFGDAAAAAVVSYDPDSNSSCIKAVQKTHSEGVYDAMIEGGGCVNYIKDHPYDQEMHSFKMHGRKLLRMAKKQIPLFMRNFFHDLEMDLEDVDAIIPHQASRMGLHIFTSLYNFKENQVKSSLLMHGNCIAASIPLTLAQCIESGDIQRGQTCLLTGTSAGFSIGGILIKY